jgi:endo-1,3(4)-beta-glucanase
MLTTYKLFENKVDHTTFFGNNPEYIQGIHMLPVSPISGYTRSRKFVLEEWQRYFQGDNYTPQDAAWTSLLRGNQALIDPVSSYNFFSSNSYSNSMRMEGDSRAYYLFYSAVLAGIW